MLRRTDGLVSLSEGGTGAEWLIARASCAYTLVDARAIPAGKRKGFLEVAVRRWSPFADTRYHAAWADGQAMVWAWSASAVALEGEAAPGPPAAVFPESVFRGAPEEDGSQLLALDEGFEGRVWRGRVLAASSWWPAIPSPDEWCTFLRGAAVEPSASVPQPLAAPIRDTAWTRQRTVALNDLASRYRVIAAAAVLAAATCAVAAPLAASLRLVVKTALLERVIERESTKVAHILAARESAERDRAAVDGLLALRPPARQLQLLGAVIRGTPGSGWSLREWRMPDKRTAEAVLRMPNPDPAALVRGWEQTGLFRDVAVDLGRSGGDVTVRARVAAAPAGADDTTGTAVP